MTADLVALAARTEFETRTASADGDAGLLDPAALTNAAAWVRATRRAFDAAGCLYLAPDASAVADGAAQLTDSVRALAAELSGQTPAEPICAALAGSGPGGLWLQAVAAGRGASGALAVFFDAPRVCDADQQARLRHLSESLGATLEAHRLTPGHDAAAAALDALDAGVLVFDAADRLTLANGGYRRLFPTLARHARPGAAFDELAQAEDALAAAPGAGRQAGSAERQLADGRWIRVAERRLAAGERLISYVDVTDIRQRAVAAEALAFEDPLTRLPNRLMLSQTIDGRADPAPFAVICLDLDNFALVNQTLGHLAGDRLLCEAVARLRAQLGPDDLLARLGGDDLAVVLTGAQADDVETAAEELLAQLSEPFEIFGQRVVLGASLGAAVARAGADAAQALKEADLALRSAKADGKGRVRLFDAELGAAEKARRTLEDELRHALERDEFELRYQPQVDARGARLLGFEALLRWRHPSRGLTAPNDFIGLAEETGLIIPIGDWVLETACAAAARWAEPMRLAVNVSPIQFRHADLVGAVEGALARSGLPPERLELEITETAVLRETEENVRILHALKALGVRIAMDDFGVGYTSLSRLRRFPVDKIKIDRSFVADLGARADTNAIVRAIAHLGVSLGVETTAEGVETLEQLNHVVAEGCSEIQGFYYGEAVEAGVVDAMIARFAKTA